MDAITLANQHRNFVVTTGTGSGKSLCYFLPIIDRILKAKATGEPPRTRAIIIYPINALANSQMEELDKRVKGSGNENEPRSNAIPARTTRKRARVTEAQRPDILLTNFMTLELLLTRQNEHDQQVVRNCEGLEFLVLDELHTYRGRQGADVAMLVRRVRERLQKNDRPILCIGTSATMASEGEVPGRSRWLSRQHSVRHPDRRILRRYRNSSSLDQREPRPRPNTEKRVEGGCHGLDPNWRRTPHCARIPSWPGSR